MKSVIHLTLFLFLTPVKVTAQDSLSDRTFQGQLFKDEITTAYITSMKIVRQSDIQNHHVKNADVLLNTFNGQLITNW